MFEFDDVSVIELVQQLGFLVDQLDALFMVVLRFYDLNHGISKSLNNLLLRP